MSDYRWVNIVTQATEVPPRMGGTENPAMREDVMLANGFRKLYLVNEAPEPLPGYERSMPPLFIELSPYYPERATTLVRDTLKQDRLDREAAEAAQAAYLATLPRQEPTGIEAPVVVLQQADGSGLGIVADGDGITTYLDHASPRPDAATIAARQAQARLDNQTHRQRIAAIAVDLDQVETALTGLDLTATGPFGVAIVSTTGANKTAFTACRTAMQDIKTAARNLRQACEKLRREVR